ncbi:arginase family protein [Aquirhabdus sp.]|uniref:arginase family protein n=1 Tax=Aquirhabdus sp. TaxID=2824160 RepID=UPI00396CC54E
MSKNEFDSKRPVVLDFDHAVGAFAHESRIDLFDWQERIRFGCGLSTFKQLSEYLDHRLPESYGTVFMGSGDYHHVTLALLERLSGVYSTAHPIEVVVFDNHPDNMRFPFGVHCGSWVKHVAKLPFVQHVHVIGITSSDIGVAHAWENYLAPLYQQKVSYWCLDVNVNWAKYVGLAHAFHRFENADALVKAFIIDRNARVDSSSPIYLSIDKDVFAPEVAQTNWDQGVLLEAHVMQIIDALQGDIIGSDVTGEISSWQYTTWWKRWMSSMDGQALPEAEDVQRWQLQHHALNDRLLAALSKAKQV